LLDAAGGLPWRDLQGLVLQPERSVTLAQPLAALETLWDRHCCTGVPLQHLVGQVPWRDLWLDVGPEALIPRQETELLVDLALALGPAPRCWADLGTGSGCLAVALARAWPASLGWAVDRSSEALALARRNLDRLAPAAAVEVLQGDWWQPLTPWRGQLERVVANPPYIPSAVVEALDPMVRDHEPRLALDGGGDGLGALRQVIAAAPVMLAPGGWLLLEHHHDQGAAVRQLLLGAGLQDCRSAPDLEGHSRFALARRSPDEPADG
jgi:release factor glutamine methyltransferase